MLCADADHYKTLMYQAEDVARQLQAELERLRARDEEAEAARANLIRVLEIEPLHTWDDITAYAAKSKGTARIALAAVERRTDQRDEARAELAEIRSLHEKGGESR